MNRKLKSRRPTCTSTYTSSTHIHTQTDIQMHANVRANFHSCRHMREHTCTGTHTHTNARKLALSHADTYQCVSMFEPRLSLRFTTEQLNKKNGSVSEQRAGRPHWLTQNGSVFEQRAGPAHWLTQNGSVSEQRAGRAHWLTQNSLPRGSVREGLQ